MYELVSHTVLETSTPLTCTLVQKDESINYTNREQVTTQNNDDNKEIR